MMRTKKDALVFALVYSLTWTVGSIVWRYVSDGTVSGFTLFTALSSGMLFFVVGFFVGRAIPRPQDRPSGRRKAEEDER